MMTVTTRPQIRSSPTRHLLQSLLFGVGATDLGTMLVATQTLATVAFCAGYIPWRRAMRLFPMQALRFE
jgi:ABC-type lipoprotein release transport system permease subunit